eukprot:1161225-Pelagomonas_calceolata.AAC.3
MLAMSAHVAQGRNPLQLTRGVDARCSNDNEVWLEKGNGKVGAAVDDWQMLVGKGSPQQADFFAQIPSTVCPRPCVGTLKRMWMPAWIASRLWTFCRRWRWLAVSRCGLCACMRACARAHARVFVYVCACMSRLFHVFSIHLITPHEATLASGAALPTLQLSLSYHGHRLPHHAAGNLLRSGRYLSSHAILQITPYRAGHVLGAAMFMVEIAGMRCLYTGDYSRVPDRHLPGADTPDVQPDMGGSGGVSCPFMRCLNTREYSRVPDRHLPGADSRCAAGYGWVKGGLAVYYVLIEHRGVQLSARQASAGG